MIASNSRNQGTRYVLIAILTTLILSFGCHSKGNEIIQRQQLSQRLIELEQHQGWHILVHRMDDISYLCQSERKLEAIYSRFSKPIKGWIGFGSISADGKKLSLATEPYEQRSATLTVFDIESGKEERILTMPYLFGPRWSLDGKRIAFASRSGSRGNFDLNVYDIATSDVSPLLAGELPSGEGYFDWSPDGQRIIYENAAGDVAIIDLQTKKKRTLGKGGSPRWSPDGKLICYHKDGEDALVLRDVETDQSRMILKGKRASSPAWSPDGRYLSYSRPYSGISKQIKDLSMLVDTRGDLWAMDTASEVEVKLFTAEESIYPTYWGPIVRRPLSASSTLTQK